ncbi:hypothetical protein WEI85_03185 [Actinomycetes bacterium KLBMP 9797]
MARAALVGVVFFAGEIFAGAVAVGSDRSADSDRSAGWPGTSVAGVVVGPRRARRAGGDVDSLAGSVLADPVLAGSVLAVPRRVG